MRKNTLACILAFFFFAITFYKANAQTIFTKAGDGTPADYGPAIAGQLYSPLFVAIDGVGNLYIADAQNNRVRKVNAADGKITTIAGTGIYGYSGDGGLATVAQIAFPSGIVVDSGGNIYIADLGNNRVRKISTSGIIMTVAGNGSSGYSGNGGLATAAALNGPSSVELDNSGNIFIADSYNNRIRKVNASDGKIITIAGTGYPGYSGDGNAATAASLQNPNGITIDLNQNIYIADEVNHRVRKINAADGKISTIAGNGTAGFGGDGGPAISAALNDPRNIEIDAVGNIYIADANNNRIRKINPSGIITTIAGNGMGGYSGDGGLATAAQLAIPTSVVIDGGGNLYISDENNNRVRKINTSDGKITTIVGGGANDNIIASVSSLYGPMSLAFDGSGNIYVADWNNHRIRRIDANGIITTVAGNGIKGYGGDGGLATAAQLDQPQGVSVDGNGNIYIADLQNHRIRKVSAIDGKITTVAGNGTLGYNGDGILATSASLFYPSGVVVDGNGNIYIADYQNNRIRKVSVADGKISTVAGNGTSGYSGDGGVATAAQIANPTDLATDVSGNIYIADYVNQRIRKVNSIDGKISTIAGNGTLGYSGDGGAATAAQLNYPRGLTVDGSGNIYIADYSNSRVRKVSGGIITTVAGNGIQGFSGDGGLATAAQLDRPADVALAPDGNLYIADHFNSRIRYICPLPSTGTSMQTGSTNFYPTLGNAAIAFNNNCSVILKITRGGSQPIEGFITDTVWVESSVPTYNGQPYVQRHYGITPSQNGATATATLTLYYTQAEFTAYNAAPNHGLDLPVNAIDAANNKANVRVIKRSGTSNNGTGLFDTYSGVTTGITPTNVVWDANLNAWAVTLDVTGFSGFFLTSGGSILPLKLTDFTAKLKGNDGLINWHTLTEENTARFEVERSTDNRTYTKAGSVNAAGYSSSPLTYSFTDINVVSLGASVIYYRLKMMDNDGDSRYSKVVPVNISKKEAVVLLYPNPADEQTTLQIASLQKEIIRYSIIDATGRVVYAKEMNAVEGGNTASIDIRTLPSGIYTLLVRGTVTKKELKLVKQ